jgi:endoglycosylceramidase
MTAHFDALDALGLGGTEWEYSVATEEWNDETDSLVHPDGSLYPVAAAVTRPFARAVAGTGVSARFDSKSGTFTLSFAPSASGTTEVSVPGGAYPKGFEVELTGGCVDDSQPGLLLVKSDDGAAKVALTVKHK